MLCVFYSYPDRYNSIFKHFFNNIADYYIANDLDTTSRKKEAKSEIILKSTGCSSVEVSYQDHKLPQIVTYNE